MWEPMRREPKEGDSVSFWREWLLAGVWQRRNVACTQAGCGKSRHAGAQTQRTGARAKTKGKGGGGGETNLGLSFSGWGCVLGWGWRL